MSAGPHAAALAAIADKFDWDRIACGPVGEPGEHLVLAEFERIKPHDEKVMMLFHDDEIVAVTIKVGNQIGRAPETASPAEMFMMIVSAMATI